MTQEPTMRPKRSVMKRLTIVFGTLSLIILGLGLISIEIPFGLLVLFLFLASGFVQVVGLCLIGWIFFLQRIGADIQFDLWSLAIGIGAFALLTYGIQVAIRQFFPNGKWTTRQTVRCVACAVGVFISGICLIGVGHELTWSTRAQTPWLVVVDTWMDSSYRHRSQRNLHQFGVAVTEYESASNQFPSGGGFRQDGTAEHGWMTSLLPYLDQKPLFEQIRLDIPWYHPENQKVFETRISIFEDPRLRNTILAPGEYARASYAGNDKVLNANPGFKRSQVSDGMSNTIFAGEVKETQRPWGDAANWRSIELGVNQSPIGFGSPNKSSRIQDGSEKPGAQFLMMDGTVRFLTEETDPRLLRALATPDAGDTAEGL